MSGPLRIGLLGATGALANEVLEVLAGSANDPRTGLRLKLTRRACLGLLSERLEKTAKPLSRVCRWRFWSSAASL